MSFLPFLPMILVFILFFQKISVAFAMIIATLFYYVFINTTMPVEISVQRIITSMESFPYLAIPFFACAGVVFNYAGITRRLMGFADVLVGHMTGGLGQVNVLLSTLMGGLSGSANADAAMESKILVPEMERLGYGKAFSTVVTASSSCITPIIPPGIILILYAVAADVSIARMFFAGYIPGFLICVALMATVAVISKKRKYAPSRAKGPTGREVLDHLKESAWALFLPFGILMGLRFGMFTPTEAGAISVFYAVLVGVFVYKELRLKHIEAILMESVEATAGVMFIIAAANAFGSYLTWERIPITITEVLISNISSPAAMLFIIMVLLLVVGCFFEGGAAMVLLAPLLVPAVSKLGVDLVHFGIVMCINLTIAGFTPPFGTMMFVTTSITGVKIEDYIRESIPFIAALIGVLFLLVYVPDIVLFIPNLLMG